MRSHMKGFKMIHPGLALRTNLPKAVTMPTFPVLTVAQQDMTAVTLFMRAVL